MGGLFSHITKSCFKRPLRQYWFLSLKCYSDWKFGAIQIELTTLTPLITEDSAKQLVNSLQLTVICMIGQLREGNVSFVSPSHSEILILPMEYLLGRKLL